MKDKISISIPPELHSAIIIASMENNVSVSKAIESLLRDSPDCQRLLVKAKEYAESEENVNPSAVSSEYISHLRKGKP